jgi:DNA-directed RNA polymerase specialized sigma24 family protein
MAGPGFPRLNASASDWTGPSAQAIGATGVLGLAVLVALPCLSRPAPGPEATRRDRRPSGARVVAWLRDATRLMGLAAFERGVGLLDAARAAEDALPLLARHFAEAWRGGLGPGQMAQSLAAGEVSAPPPGTGAPGLAVRKVAARRALEGALHGLAPGPRAVAYLRLAAGLPLGEVARLTGRSPDEVGADFGAALETLAPLAESSAQNA